MPVSPAPGGAGGFSISVSLYHIVNKNASIFPNLFFFLPK
jgi:hypothetical protein